ncbi:hypothetical protein TcWFU_002136 [Taenia crassiceps]|uniref:Uncharacterized protein n=1 Tax=Taenia crassiceps TaxID=6207 RepID=A0ABR4Q306_9CEST
MPKEAVVFDRVSTCQQICSVWENGATGWSQDEPPNAEWTWWRCVAKTHPLVASLCHTLLCQRSKALALGTEATPRFVPLSFKHAHIAKRRESSHESGTTTAQLIEDVGTMQARASSTLSNCALRTYKRFVVFFSIIFTRLLEVHWIAEGNWLFIADEVDILPCFRGGHSNTCTLLMECKHVKHFPSRYIIISLLPLLYESKDNARAREALL